jgi:hypothetical protein
MKQRLFQRSLEGGNTAGAAASLFSNLSDITNTATMMKRE